MTNKYGDRSTIYQKVYPHLNFLIQKDIDSYWNEDNDNIFRCPNDQFSTKWYRRHMGFYGMMGINSGSQFTLYSGGIGMGCGYNITFNIDTLKYSFISVNDELWEYVVYESSDWNDMIMKVDSCLDSHRDTLTYIK